MVWVLISESIQAFYISDISNVLKVLTLLNDRQY